MGTIMSGHMDNVLYTQGFHLIIIDNIVKDYISFIKGILLV